LPEAERLALAGSARAVLTGGAAALGAELRAAEAQPRAAGAVAVALSPDAGPGLSFDEPLREFNGFGGFSADGREYVVRMPWEPGRGLRRPPLPWTNVIANEGFGFLVSETGSGSTWSVNSREHRLTPWSNDPVLDPHGEALWLRDDATGRFWSPVPGPTPAPAAYEARHGFGSTTFRHESGGLYQEVCCFADAREGVRVTRVRLTNRTDRPRKLSVYCYQRLVLGVLPAESGRFVATEHDESERVLLARNPMAGEFADRVAFAACVTPEAVATRQVSCDRESFLGAGGMASPVSLSSGGALDGRAGAGLDPCFAERVSLLVQPGETMECAFAFGDSASADQAIALVRRLRAPGAVQASLDGAKGFWETLVSGVRIETPMPELDLMVNGWLAYQTLSCRIWGRTAFYQSGGAFGFRDQLQDATSLLALRPELARAQLVLNAGHQFAEGDVLHWWHPPLAKGIRTRFADDLLWLPYLAAHYVVTTGDWSVLDERVRWLSAPPLPEGEDEAFLVPSDSGQAADVYEHCCRAIDRSLVTGAHGLPLFGSGDWNDGMNRVGREGRGESVWMGFFLHATLGDFAPLCERRGDHERLARYTAFRDRLRPALEEGGWDGEWYRRAYYDDGTPLGSKQGDECRIDGLAQAWAVISGAAPSARARSAMAAAERELVDREAGLIRLLTPAFRDTPHDPGYIKGYVAGVRENGGQYTHAALWFVRALAELGARDRAAPLLAMLSPVSHARDAGQVARYRAEPYVIAADVYGEAPHVGRGGWTWYTGSAGWMLRVSLENVLGLRLVGGQTLVFRPCVPDTWSAFAVTWRIPGSKETYEFRVRNPAGSSAEVVAAKLDGASLPVTQGVLRVPLAGDGRSHRVEVELGSGTAGRAATDRSSAPTAP
jgi:cyclic beta-1,2-glucan synthetase